MLLFLDVISPIPEFCLIEDNKVVLKRKIITNSNENLSDNIVEVYLKIKEDMSLSSKLTKIAITIGPGSFTSLRVGAAFISALKISKNLPYYEISVEDFFNFELDSQQKEKTAFFLSSSKNQKFLIISNKNIIEYFKVETSDIKIPEQIDKIYYNFQNINCNKEVFQIKFDFLEFILQNYKKFNFKKNGIIKPIYISNNKILN